MIRGQPRPVRVAESEPDVERAYPALGVWMLLSVLLAPFAVIGFLWLAYYAVKALGVGLVVLEAVLR